MYSSEIKQKLWELFLALVLIAFLLILGKILDVFSLEVIAAGVVIVLFLIIANTVIVSRFVRTSILDDIKACTGSLREQILILERMVTPKDIPWLKLHTTMNEIERTTTGSEIWIISPDLGNDTGDGPFVSELQKIVQSNMRRGIKYTYIMPDTEKIWGSLVELREEFTGYSNSLDVRVLNPDKFRLLADTHIVVFNPRSENKQRPNIYLELPLENKGWWIKLSEIYAVPLIGRIQQIIDRGEGRVDSVTLNRLET